MRYTVMPVERPDSRKYAHKADKDASLKETARSLQGGLEALSKLFSDLKVLDTTISGIALVEIPDEVEVDCATVGTQLGIIIGPEVQYSVL